MNIARGAKAHLLLIGNISKHLDYNLLHGWNMRVYTRVLTFINQVLDFHIPPHPSLRYLNLQTSYVCIFALSN